jgi:ferric-dicitrate binding protein FerR (iron transport regulator)
MNPDARHDDPAWHEAWHWVQIEHEQSWTPGQRAEFDRWLAADPSNRARHAEASRLWLLAGLVPPAHVRTPDGGDDPEDEARGR